jgi:hypothetical protein
MCIDCATLKLIVLQILNLTKQFDRQGKRIAEMQRSHALLTQQDAGHIKRLPHIMQVSMRQHVSTCKLSQRIMKAIEGTYRPSGQWSGWELDIALLSLRLGGYRPLYALSRVFGLPSLRTLMRNHIRMEIEACLLAPDVGKMVKNLKDKLVLPRADGPRSLVGCQIALDETALKSQGSYHYTHKAFACVCSDSNVTREELIMRYTFNFDAKHLSKRM